MDVFTEAVPFVHIPMIAEWLTGAYAPFFVGMLFRAENTCAKGTCTHRAILGGSTTPCCGSGLPTKCVEGTAEQQSSGWCTFEQR
eukprot:32245-Eustigmatos_ZCMA.PRE.1